MAVFPLWSFVRFLSCVGVFQVAIITLRRLQVRYFSHAHGRVPVKVFAMSRNSAIYVFNSRFSSALFRYSEDILFRHAQIRRIYRFCSSVLELVLRMLILFVGYRR